MIKGSDFVPSAKDLMARLWNPWSSISGLTTTIVRPSSVINVTKTLSRNWRWKFMSNWDIRQNWIFNVTSVKRGTRTEELWPPILPKSTQAKPLFIVTNVSSVQCLNFNLIRITRECTALENSFVMNVANLIPIPYPWGITNEKSIEIPKKSCA